MNSLLPIVFMNTTNLLAISSNGYAYLDPNTPYVLESSLLFFVGLFMFIGIIGLLRWILQAIPTYKLAKKAGYKNAFLAWIPILGSLFRLYVLAVIPSDKPFELFAGKIKINSRPHSFWTYVAIAFLGNLLITILVIFLNIIPFWGTILSLFACVLYLLPPVALAIMEYVYLKDVIDIFKKDKNSNRTAAILVTVFDSLVTGGFARAIYLFTLLKYDVIVPEVIEAEPVNEESTNAN